MTASGEPSTGQLLDELETQLRKLVAALEQATDPEILAQVQEKRARRARADLRVVGDDDA
jgi:hypothetical protein